MSHGRERSHKRSRSGSRDQSPFRGSLDSTSDPSTVNARIFVGSITESITREQLQRHFSRWGNVIGATVTKNNFGFVQFDKEEAAQLCLASGYITIMDGMKLDVKPAKIGPGMPPGASAGNHGGGHGPNWGGGHGGRPPSKFPDRGAYDGGRDRSPRRDDYYDSYYGSKNARSHNPYDSEYPSDYYRDYYDRNNDSYYHDEPSSMPAPPPQQAPSEVSTTRGGYDSIFSQEPLDPLDPARPNDVEIVVPNKMQRPYAERIEAQLRRINLLVDLLFPPPDITADRVLSDLASRNCLYAIFVTIDNEKHCSLTVNILHGETQEHRNMPVDDAMRLIQQNFEEYVKKNRLRNMREIVPRDIRNLVLDLLEMRPLSMGDLDKLIKYLRERQNSLVDHQIEQKRETVAGNQTMAITYPGYSYVTTSMAGPAAAPVEAANHVAGVLQPAAVAGPVSIVTAPNAAAAVAYQTAYQTVPGMPANVISTFGIPQQQAPLIQATGETKQHELQERILNLMKGPTCATPVAPGVPPTAVPAPAAVPPPVAPPGFQHADWSAKPGEQKLVQGNQNVYNPWSQ